MSSSITTYLALIILLLLAIQNSYGAASEIPQNMTNTEACATLLKEYIVFADLHIIEAIKGILESNSTGASNQLLAAEGWLSEATELITRVGC